MWTGLDLLGRLDGFLETFDLIKHLLRRFLFLFFLGNRKLLDNLVTKLFDFGFKDGNEVFHDVTFVRYRTQH